MKKVKLWKRMLGLTISLTLLVPSVTASASEEKPKQQSGEALAEEAGISVVNAQQRDFEIEDGVLYRYYGTASRVVVPKQVKEISDRAFEYCEMKSIELPEGLKTIGIRAFSDCKRLKSIKLPKNLKNLGGEAFLNCTSLTKIEVAAGNKAYKSYDGCLYNYKGDQLIACPAGKKEVSILKSVKTIGRSAFINCNNLKQIELPGGVTRIEASAFLGCSSLAGIVLPSGVNYIGGSVFQNCRSLASIELPSGVTAIEWQTFLGCEKLKRVKLPDKLTKIGELAFSGCKSLKSMKLPDGVTSIGREAFYGCCALTSITIPESVKKIGAYEEDIDDGPHLKYDSSYIFDWDEAHKGRVTIYGKKNSFAHTYAQKFKIRFRAIGAGKQPGQDTAEIKKGATFTVNGLKYKILNNSKASFAGIKNVKTAKVTIPATININGKTFKVTAIAAGAFKNNKNVTAVTVGKNITAIGANAFSGCKKLGTITIQSAKLETVGKNACKGIKSTAKIKVPKAKEKAYRKLLKGKGLSSKAKVVKG